AYQVSFVDQFEFVTANWVNNANFKENGAGHDPIIGQNDQDPKRVRSFRLNLPGEAQPITTDQDWVMPTGGGYFFAPSIKALKQLAGIDSATQGHKRNVLAASKKRKGKVRRKK